MEQEHGKDNITALQEYQTSRSLTVTQAKQIVDTLWKDAPRIEKYKAASICVQYGLNPLMGHVHLIPFKNKRTQMMDYVVVLGINATRIIAQQEKQYSYIDDSPRMMDAKEQERVFGEVDANNLVALCVLQDDNGRIYRGYGRWPRADEPYGTDKGNTKANMCFMRAERQALSRMAPGKIPTDLEVMDENMIPSITEVDKLTGEIKSQTESDKCPIHPGAVFKEYKTKKGQKFMAHLVDGEKAADGKPVWCTPKKAQEDLEARAKAEVDSNAVDGEFADIPEGDIVKEVEGMIKEMGYPAGGQKMKDLLSKYPNCHIVSDLSEPQLKDLKEHLIELIALKRA